MLKSFEAYSHITSHAWVSVDPPRPSNSCLAVENSKLVEAEDFFQTTAHSNTTLPGANDGNGVICIAPRVVAIVLMYRIPIHLVQSEISAHYERKDREEIIRKANR